MLDEFGQLYYFGNVRSCVMDVSKVKILVASQAVGSGDGGFSHNSTIKF